MSLRNNRADVLSWTLSLLWMTRISGILQRTVFMPERLVVLWAFCTSLWMRTEECSGRNKMRLVGQTHEKLSPVIKPALNPGEELKTSSSLYINKKGMTWKVFRQPMYSPDCLKGMLKGCSCPNPALLEEGVNTSSVSPITCHCLSLRS